MNEQPKKPDVKFYAKLDNTAKNKAFFQAVKAGNTVVMKLLMEAKVELTNYDKNQALFNIVREPNANATVKMLLDIKADPSSYKYVLSGVDNVDVISMLIAEKAVFDVETLNFTASNGKVDTLRILIDAKVDVNTVDKRSNTALHHAAEFNQHEAIAFLLKAKATPGTRNDEGNTPLLMVAKKGIRFFGDYESLKLLLDAKAEVNAIDNLGRTALHSVVQPKADGHGKVLMNWDKEEVKNLVNILLEAKADRSLRDNLPRSTLSTAGPTTSSRRGKTAYEYAIENGHTDLDNLFPHYPLITADNYRRSLTFLTGLHPRVGENSVVTKAYDKKRTGMSELRTIGLICKFGRGKPTPIKEPAKKTEEPAPERDSGCIII